jgi:O-antigen ligase
VLAPTFPPSRIHQILNWALVIGICLVLGFGPLAFGAVQPWSVCVLEMAVSLLVVIWVARETASGGFRIINNQLYIPMALFAGVVLIQISFHLTAYWYITWTKGLLWASYAGLFFLASEVFHERQLLFVFGFFCAGYGFLLALFAIIQEFTSNGKIYWVVSPRNGGWIYGSYVNHANYAGLMEMLIPFALVFTLTNWTGRAGRVFFLFTAVIMSSTIFLALSLGGMIAFSAELAVLSWVLFRGSRSAYGEISIVALLCIALILWLVWLRPAGLMDRLASLLNPTSDAGVTNRVAIIRDSLRMLRDRPVLGWGLGTFPIVYPSYKSFFTNSWVNEAHNDFVQTLVETGIVGFTFAASFLVMLWRKGIRNLKHWRSDIQSSMAFAAFLGCIGILVHGLFNFNLQIPANAAFFFILSVLVTSSRFSESKVIHDLDRNKRVARHGYRSTSRKIS